MSKRRTHPRNKARKSDTTPAPVMYPVPVGPAPDEAKLVERDQPEFTLLTDDDI